MSYQSYGKSFQIPEFLRQLVKMLKDKKYSEMIVWEAGRIIVYDPAKLAKEVLHKHYKHSNFSSFQRQLNSFGFKKVALKIDSTTSPCCFNNKNTTSDVLSVLHLKRKKGIIVSKSTSSGRIFSRGNLKATQFHIERVDQQQDGLIRNEHRLMNETFGNSRYDVIPTQSADTLIPTPSLPIIPNSSMLMDRSNTKYNSISNPQTRNNELLSITQQNFQPSSHSPQKIVNCESNMKIGSPTEKFLDILSSYVESDKKLKESDPYEPIPLDIVMSKHANEFYINLSKYIDVNK